jgi:hypothetical protein
VAVELRLEIEPKTREALARLTPEGAAIATREALKAWAPELRRVLAVNSPGSKPGNTGAYRRAWDVRVVGDNVVAIANRSGHAIYVEEDTKAHRIEPIRASILRWRVAAGRVSAARASRVYTVTKAMRKRVAAGKAKAGDWIFAKVVHHPGTRGQHVLQRSLNETAPRLLDLLFQRINGAFGGNLR